MTIPLVQTYRIARYILEQKLKGNKRYPLVLMLEPLFQCNLACSGCGKIDVIRLAPRDSAAAHAVWAQPTAKRP